jgi:hypothetical protein
MLGKVWHSEGEVRSCQAKVAKRFGQQWRSLAKHGGAMAEFSKVQQRQSKATQSNAKVKL